VWGWAGARAGSRIKYLWDYNSNKIMVPQVFSIGGGIREFISL